MAAQANVVILDGAGTPASRTFAPKGVVGIDQKQTKAVWRENAGLYLGQPTIEEYHTLPNSNGIEKFKWVFKLPTLQTVGTNDAGITPPAGVAYVTMATVEFNLPQSATDLELSHIRAFVENFAATVQFENSVELRDATW